MSARIDSPSARLTVAVLAGGHSAERDVSLASGAAVCWGLSELGHRVSIIDPATRELCGVDWSAFDAVFLALHGTFGEDGEVQELLETAGVPFTGSDAATSRLAFSKSAAKERFLQHAVPTPEYVLIHADDDRQRITQLAARIGFPLVVKPDRQGSSLGVTIVESPGQIDDALELCFGFDEFALLESAVIGTEWTVGLIDDRVLPAIRIETPRGFYDYAAKYEDDATRYHFETQQPTDVVRHVEEIGRRAAVALGTRGIARVDLRLDESQRPWVLEVNTTPGFTDHSLLPKAAERAGIAFPQLCQHALVNCMQGAIGTTGAALAARRRAG